MPKRNHKRHEEEHYSGDSNENAESKLLHLLGVALLFLELAVVAASSTTVLYWATAGNWTTPCKGELAARASWV